MLIKVTYKINGKTITKECSKQDFLEIKELGVLITAEKTN